MKLEDFIERLNLKVIYSGKTGITIDINEICRPGLQLAGYYNYFSENRVQIIGKSEMSYIEGLPKYCLRKRIKKYLSSGISYIIVSRNLVLPKDFTDIAQKNRIWILSSNLNTTDLIDRIYKLLSSENAKTLKYYGVFLDVYGLGILLTGDKGIGKSETALELIKRGHRLVAGNVAIIKMVDNMLIGSDLEDNRGLNIHGLGYLDISSLYGLNAVMSKKQLELIINLSHIKENIDIERLGVDYQFEKILELDVRKIDLPVIAGRNIAILIEAAAVNYRYSLMNPSTIIDTINSRML